MQRTPAPYRLFGICAALLLLSAGVGASIFFALRGAPPASPDLSYYRAVYVLQQMGGPAALESQEFPSRNIRGDATESLLHHPDKIFVLRSLADDLTGFADSQPKARLFEAYARMSLGEKKRAADLLARYVCDSPYQAAHYALLCELLQEQEEYASLMLICREWRERDPSCLPQRSIYTWAALYGLQRFQEAGEYMEHRADCLGWQSGVYAARAFLAQGQGEKARGRLVQTERDFPAEKPAIDRLWRFLEIQPRLFVGTPREHGL